MFPYQDPTGTDCLKRQGALETYQGKLHTQYETAAQIPDTKFVPVQAFSGLQPSGQPDRVITLLPGATFSNAIVPWNAFPRRNQAVNNAQVDTERTLQEEYTEWVVQSNAGKLSSVTFTTEFAAYFQTLADISFEALVAGIKEVIPNANPTVSELLGVAQKPTLLTADGIVGPMTWDLIGRMLDRPPSDPPTLQLGSKGEPVIWLQTRLTWLGLYDGKLDGNFNSKTQAAVIAAQKRYVGAGELFRQNLLNNPWNNGKKGLLCMANFDNTLPLLFGLLAHCAVPRDDVAVQEVCQLVGGRNCVPGRSSDPNVCGAVQIEVRNGNVLSPSDPVGIFIMKLQGIWRINNVQIDINDPQKNQGAWVVSRGNHRAVLKNLPGLTLDGAPITTGSQVARKLQVGARVMIAATKDIQR
jgi:peptidoglycan hydrolase-like protein with peptidoglycan-binding domain